MRLRNLLAATAACAVLVGAVAMPATAATAPSPANAGSVFTWGQGPAPVPEDLNGPVLSVATNDYATGVVTLDGEVRVWGDPALAEVTEVPNGISDATTITLGYGDVYGNAAGHNGAVLHADGRVTAWGDTEAIGEVPSELRAKAIALQRYTGFAVRTDGILTTWGDEPGYAAPLGLTGLVDVSASPTGVVALRADGTVVAWGSEGIDAIPDFGGHKVTEVSAGLGYVLVRLDDGTLKGWGDSLPMGMPDFDGQSPAGRVIDVSASSPLGAGAVTADGAVHMWGANTWNLAPEELTGKPVSAVATSQYQTVAVVTAFRELTEPTIAGTPTAGQTLTATPATFTLTSDAPATGQWYAENDPIAGKTSTSLFLDAAVVGKSISYRTTATRGEDTVTSASTALGPVTKAASSITLSASPASATAGSKRTVTATVTSPAGTPTGTITFTVGSTHATATLSGGNATWTLPTQTIGRHTVTATYGGNSATTGSTSTAATITVTKASSKVSGRVKATGKTKKVAKTVTITLTVTSAKGVSPAGKVKLTLSGATKKTVTASVNAKGTATVTLRNVKRGKYTAAAAYAGNVSVSGANGLVKFQL